MNKKLNFIINILIASFAIISSLNSGLSFHEGDITKGLGWLCAFLWCLNSLILKFANETD